MIIMLTAMYINSMLTHFCVYVMLYVLCRYYGDMLLQMHIDLEEPYQRSVMFVNLI